MQLLGSLRILHTTTHPVTRGNAQQLRNRWIESYGSYIASQQTTQSTNHSPRLSFFSHHHHQRTIMTDHRALDHPEKLSPVEYAKRQAAYRAVQDHFNPAARYVGIGSGSTVVYVVEAIAAWGTEVTSKIYFIPTGFQSRELIVEAGLPLGAIDSLVPLDALTGLKTGPGAKQVATGLQDMGLKGEKAMLDVVFDGADEIDKDLNCIKGGGACLFQEKLVATNARKFICVAGTIQSIPPQQLPTQN